ncbi:MAG: Uma2 family endonuclease [Leptolyngbyaceae cyanobacterium RM2_2_4]|nr:Uma2 family endonuclease [Leptolyngbyaceae cyanobacterium SM1_4_3]NJN91737.1 Uma2 family endonuclease [Leptolyngbyaceae cyanobacterium SL_5_14]NJO50795.1 Uma2 family endonuclease [Leptolyngbyaceae cyanobacterium RM2_2_4]NJO66666.1 Uma2 family endonuclease [Leptolyngbyaceae cyanobacterium RM1_405_57]
MVKTPPHQKLLPPLENGDRLNRYEFERRYNAMTRLKKAELVEGIVYVPAALRFRSHGQPHGRLITWLGVYESSTFGVALGIEPTVRLDLDNEPQPDAVLLIEESCGGQARLSEDDYVEGAPELVAEIAASSAAIDLGDKKRAYRRNGIQEYIVWQVFDQKVDWFYLEEGEYVSLPIEAEGVIRSRMFPGLWLAVNDLLAGNMVQVLAVIQQGLASPEHIAFVQQLSKQD